MNLASREMGWIITVMVHLSTMITKMKDKETRTSQMLFSRIPLTGKINKSIPGSKALILLNTLKITSNCGTKLKGF